MLNVSGALWRDMPVDVHFVQLMHVLGFPHGFFDPTIGLARSMSRSETLYGMRPSGGDGEETTEARVRAPSARRCGIPAVLSR